MNKKIYEINNLRDFIIVVIGAIAIFFVLTVFYMWIWKVAIVALFPFMPMPSFWQFVGLEILANVFFKNNNDSSWIQFKAIGGGEEVSGKDNNIK